MSDQTLAEALCSADDTQGHHEATDDYPCWQCKEKATIVLDLLTSDQMREVVAHNVAGVHHFHGESCLCGFTSARARSRSEHLATAALAAIRTELEGARDE